MSNDEFNRIRNKQNPLDAVGSSSADGTRKVAKTDWSKVLRLDLLLVVVLSICTSLGVTWVSNKADLFVDNMKEEPDQSLEDPIIISQRAYDDQLSIMLDNGMSEILYEDCPELVEEEQVSAVPPEAESYWVASPWEPVIGPSGETRSTSEEKRVVLTAAQKAAAESEEGYRKAIISKCKQLEDSIKVNLVYHEDNYRYFYRDFENINDAVVKCLKDKGYDISCSFLFPSCDIDLEPLYAE